ncbi:hypothetical protein [Aliamphritea ceti]|uniref:hypothetical protein n=1 Tax=Aliamphritea ceti TaxID=1524258 RepID=UPI0021C2D168|nr:hypothetical protein [Aliamphritea ceti]
MTMNSLQQQILQLTRKGLSLNEILEMTDAPAELVRQLHTQSFTQHKHRDAKEHNQHHQAMYAMQLGATRN